MLLLLCIIASVSSLQVKRVAGHTAALRSYRPVSGLAAPMPAKSLTLLYADKSTAGTDGKFLRDQVPFEIRGFSLPLVVFSVGVLLTATSFAGFFLDDGGAGGAASSIGFVYGIPVFLIGLSLWYAEIKPVTVVSDEGGDRAYAKHATDTLQVNSITVNVCLSIGRTCTMFYYM